VNPTTVRRWSSFPKFDLPAHFWALTKCLNLGAWKTIYFFNTCRAPMGFQEHTRSDLAGLVSNQEDILYFLSLLFVVFPDVLSYFTSVESNTQFKSWCTRPCKLRACRLVYRTRREWHGRPDKLGDWGFHEDITPSAVNHKIKISLILIELTRSLSRRFARASRLIDFSHHQKNTITSTETS
jgi:hypothetical protein